MCAQRDSLHLEEVESRGAVQGPKLKLSLLHKIFKSLDWELLAARAQQSGEVGDVGSQQGDGEQPPDGSDDPHRERFGPRGDACTTRGAGETWEETYRERKPKNFRSMS